MEFTPKREIAKQFVNLIFQGTIDKAFANYTAPEFIHHTADCEKGKDALIAYLKVCGLDKELFKHQFLRLIEQNDLVMAHLRICKLDSKEEVVAVYIFRFKEHLINEYWEVKQSLPDTLLNTDGVF